MDNPKYEFHFQDSAHGVVIGDQNTVIVFILRSGDQDTMSFPDELMRDIRGYFQDKDLRYVEASHLGLQESGLRSISHENQRGLRFKTICDLARFYGGITCVVTERIGEIHCLNGHPHRRKFEHILPLEQQLHASFCTCDRSAGKGEGSDMLDDLQPQTLRDRARVHYGKGKTSLAFGCARLAHSLRRYFMRKDVDDELSSACEALHYLRRYIGFHRDLGYRLLRYIVREEIIPALSEGPALSQKTAIRLLEGV